jgi:hypothetical protein
MAKNIIQQVIDSDSIEMLYGVLQSIPIQQIEEIIETTDTALKNQLMKQANNIHMSMQSYHNMGSINAISKEFANIEKHLKDIVYEELPMYEKFFQSIVRFFSEHSSEQKLKESIVRIQNLQREIEIYNMVLTKNSEEFLKYVQIYQNWVGALSLFVPKICDIYGTEYTELSYILSKTIVNASEFLLTQKQLEQALALQIQNNAIVITDILHTISISTCLSQNVISVQKFFKEEYIGSIKILHKYTKKK